MIDESADKPGQDAAPAMLDLGGYPIAYRHKPGIGNGTQAPGVLFLCGYRSSMEGEKAEHLARWCVARGFGFTRFDYAGHGASGGAMETGTIGRWLGDALAIADRIAGGPLILVGSSMGAWLAVLLALARPGRVRGLLGIAAAPDFTEDLIPDRIGAQGMRHLMAYGRIERPSRYSDAPDVVTRALIEEARAHLVLRAPLPLQVPLRLIHGLADPDVPWTQSQRLLEVWQGKDAELILIKDGDHRLSRPADLARITATLARLIDPGQA